MVAFVKCMLMYCCKYKEIVYPMYRYLGMGAASAAIYLQGSHIICEDLVKQKALILISYKGLARDSCRQTHTNRRLLYRVLSSIQSAKASHAQLSEEIYKPFALSRVFLLSSEGKSVLLLKKKAPSRSGFSVSMYVVLKTRHVSPNIHVRRYQSHVRRPNLSATRPQLLFLRKATVSIVVCGMNHYWYVV